MVQSAKRRRPLSGEKGTKTSRILRCEEEEEEEEEEKKETI